jgi:signal transduction histidine kinase
MNRPAEWIKRIAEHALPWFVLTILLFYSYILFFQHPFGFSWLTDGTINRIFVKQTTSPTLEVGDRLLQVGPLSWEAFHSDLRKTFFEGVKKGQITPVLIDRNGEQITVLWRLPGFNRSEMLNALASQGFLAYFFWIAGLLTTVFLRPRDERWWLLMAFNFLTAIWLITGGGLSNYHLWYSALILRMAIWLCLPVYLHLHWVYPSPLGKLSPTWLVTIYLLSVALVIAQWFQWLSNDLYFLGFLIALLGSFILLMVHFFRQADVRREVGFIVALTLFSFVPIIALAAAYTLIKKIPLVSTLVLINFGTIPFSYLFIAFRRKLGGLEIRVNRIIAFYFFIILIGAIGVPLFILMSHWITGMEGTFIMVSLTAILVAVITMWGFPRFQRFLDRHLLGISIPPEQIQESYSTRTSESTSINALVELLKDVMLPSLLVREFVFLRFNNGSPQVLLATGLSEEQIANKHLLAMTTAWKTNAFESPDFFKSTPWVQLVLPLKVGEDLLGLWLFGRRDPDDFYSQRELPMLKSLANQTAIALSNVIQTERLHAAYQNDINITEQSRTRFALELHDNVLNKMAVLMMNLDDKNLTPDFKKLYGELTAQIREMIKELRPTTLNYGILPALEDYADTLTERLDGKVRIILDLPSDGSRYSAETEVHLLRIVQEACANAIRHAGSSQIIISGQLSAEQIQLNIEDNGSGFDPKEKLDLRSMQANGHFGITGMYERAELIGATLHITSIPMHGTQIQVECKPHRP